jgi:NAD-dependent deacetylase
LNKLIVFSGAGLSADSGIATFRDSNGLWHNHDLNKVCDINTWEANYDLVHKFYDERRQEINNAKTNKMHEMLANLQVKYGIERVELWTQNIDNLLEKAGALDVKHVHGNVDEMICTTCDHVFNVGFEKEVKHECPNCLDYFIKPNVVFFGQTAPMYSQLISRFHEARIDKDCTIFVIGTSGNVVPMHWIIGKYKENKEAFKILCNKEALDVNMEIFDMCFIDNAVNVVDNLKLALEDRLDGVLTKDKVKEDPVTFMIEIYKWEGFWVFDDARVGLVKEGLINGTNLIIDELVKGCGKQKSYNLIFSNVPMFGYIELTWLKMENSTEGGHWYHSEDLNLDGWLCPALYLYFKEVPEKLYINIEVK